MTRRPDPSQDPNRRKRVIPRQPRTNEEQADYILGQIARSELERMEHEADQVIKDEEQYQRTIEKRLKAAEIQQRQAMERRSAERRLLQMAEREMEAKRPRDLEDCNSIQMRAIAAEYEVELPSLVELRRQGSEPKDVWAEMLREAGVQEPLTPEYYASLPDGTLR